jgi:uncharacterized protein YxjI
MRYLMKQKLFSLGDDFYIQDESGQNAFFVDGKVFTLGDQLSFQDLAGNELAFIRQKLLAWGPTYESTGTAPSYATIRGNFHVLSLPLSVDVPAPTTWKRRGTFWTTNILSPARDELSRPFQTVVFLGGHYGVEIADSEDDVLLLASTVVIDMACHDKKNR